LSKKKSSSAKWPPRFPPDAAGIQVNHCKNPMCANFGVPPKAVSSSIRGRLPAGVVQPALEAGDYIVVGQGKGEGAILALQALR
jgi:hypothetical protein